MLNIQVTMESRLILYDKQARDKLASGADKLARAVVSTLGPRSRNVAINQAFPAPRVLHDGVSVANNIKLEDPFEDMGAALLREAASKTNDLAGDGTTTATLLANTLLQKGKDLVTGGLIGDKFVAKVNPMQMKEELDKYSHEIVARLGTLAKPIKTEEEKSLVATISSASPEIGKLIGAALQKVGGEGLVMVEESGEFNTTVEYQEGMQFDNGYLSHYFVTDPDRMVTEYTGGGHYVLLTDQTISDAQTITPIVEKLQKLHQNKRGLVIVANDVIGPALNALIILKMQIGFPVVAVVAPEYADRRKEMLEDLAVLTGGEVIASDRQMLIKDVEVAQLGRIRSVMVTQTHTTLSPESPDAEEIKNRCEAIKKQISIEENAFRKERLQNRLAKLASSVAIIKVGGASATEIDERRERIVDAVNATKAAMAEGVIAGGGATLHHLAGELKNVGDANVYELVVETLRAPLRKLIENSGDRTYEEVMELLEASPDKGATPHEVGYDVVKEKVGNMISLGVIDPVKVTRMAVKHAFSVAGMILTTDTAITDKPDTSIQKMQIVK